MRYKRTICLLWLMAAVFGISAQRLAPPSRFLDGLDTQFSYCAPGASVQNDPRIMPPRLVDGREMVDAFIATSSGTALQMLQAMGVKVYCGFDSFVTAQVPLDRLDQVSMVPGVTDVQVSPRLTLCTDTTRSVTHVNEVMNGPANGLPLAYDGSRVIVGIIDVGFDYQHMAFKASDDQTRSRIVRVYDTQRTTGHPVHNESMGYLPGSVYMGREIDRLTTDNASATHGTHVASIAAGTHVRGYGGMAPGSDIVLCAVSVLDGSLSAVEVANCVRYIDAYADSVGMPCVISMSVSTPAGQHDGLDYLSKAIKQVMGPGRIFVISAGNTAEQNGYAHKEASKTDPLNLLFKFNNAYGDSTYYYGTMSAEVWMRSSNVNMYYKVHVVDQKIGKVVWETPELSGENIIYSPELQGYFGPFNVTDSMAYIKLKPEYVSFGRKYRLEVSARNLISQNYSTVGGVKQSRYALGLSVYPRRDAPCVIDVWTGNINSGFGFFERPVKGYDGVIRYPYYTAASDSCCIGTYAVGDSTISAGAYAARNSYYSLALDKIVYDYTVTLGQIASFSSYQVAGVGPTGKALPDICAPGTNVVAAGSRYSYFAQGNNKSTVMKINGNYWGAMSGTSMAAPTVAGIIALWLQADPQLCVSQVREVFANTAQHDQFTQQPQFGPNGKIDALAGIRYVLEHYVPQPPSTPGDVNSDGLVDILDAVTFINYLLSGQSAGFDLQAADLDKDGIIDISDLTELISMLLGK